MSLQEVQPRSTHNFSVTKVSLPETRALIPSLVICQTIKTIITHLAGQTYVWHGYKWNFAGPRIYLQPAKIKSQHFGVLLKFLVCN